MVTTFSTVNVDGLVIRTAWDPCFVGPTELLITIDPHGYIKGKGITEYSIRRLSLHTMNPLTSVETGSLRVVGDWLRQHKPIFRKRAEDPQSFFAHVALFVVLCIQEGEMGARRILANYASVTPSMAKSWIDTSRRMGMLADSSSGRDLGRVYGTLTDKARAILAASQSSFPGEMAA